MSTLDPNANASPEADTETSIEKLQSALKAEREAHKAAKAGYLAPLRTALALGDEADLDEITTALSTRLGEVDTQVNERTTALTAERDDAVARAEKIEATWTDQTITVALESAFARSGAAQQNAQDYLALAKPLFAIAPDGRIVTREGEPNLVAGMTPDQWIVGQLRSARPHWWPNSVGGGARGGGAPNTLGDTSCFDPRSKNFNLTAQFAYEARHGKAAADNAIAQYRRGVSR